jgi:putative endonuclease
MLECSDNTLYTGQTNDVNRRVDEHNAGKYCRYTFPGRPVKLMFACECKTRGDALRMEIRVKKLTRKQKLLLIKGDKQLLQRIQGD